MIVRYHCRSCNKFGEKELTLAEIAKKREELNTHTLRAISSLIECCDLPDIGIKLSESVIDNKRVK
jgi:hypothetical protein